MESQLDVALLVRRFSSLSIEEVGPLLKDYFCARAVESGTYGGRLFIMGKALVFISAYSNSKSYDCCIPLNDIIVATACYKGIMSSVEVQWSGGTQTFTNFYDLKAIESTLSDILEPEKMVVKHLGFNRMLSVPVKLTPHASLQSESGPKPPPCHFFSKCGFCPRKVVCKLDHTLHTKPSDPLSTITTTESHKATPTNEQPGHAKQVFHRSPSKKLHIQEAETEGGVSSVGLSLTPEPISKVETFRSLSSPASLENDRGSSNNNMKTPSRSGMGMKIGSQNGTSTDKQSHSSGDLKSAVSKAPEVSNFPQFAEAVALNRPKTFDFNSQLSQQVSGSSPSDEFHTPEGNFDGKGKVFVFSGSGGAVQSKRRDAATGVVSLEGVASPVQKVGLGDGEVAVLTQQLELCSDDDSLHGDLDIEAQMRIMESFSQGKPLVEPPPPYSSVVPHPLSPSTGSSSGEERGVKRLPCPYFLSGYCKKGTECPDYHGVNPDLEELEYDEISVVPIPEKIKVHSGAVIGRADINSGDKIILPPHILISCEQQQLAYPIAFKMESTVSDKAVYGGVLEFTSPTPDSAYLPQWMMEHLQAADGDEVAFEHVQLPKGTFVQLQPVSSSWLAIPYDKRMSVMEFQLRNFQTLTEGTKVTLTYELNKYTLKVLKCQPAKGISIVDSDLTTDVIEPADLQRFHSVEEGQAEHLGLGESKTCEVKGGAYRHFVLLSLPGKPLPSSLKVQVDSSVSDADLFLSQSFATPTQSRYTWCNQDIGKSEIHLSAMDEKSYHVDKPLYVGVMGAFEDTEFTISVQYEDTSESTAKESSTSPSLSGQTLRGVTSNNPSAPQTDMEPLPSGYQRCSHCGSAMPSLKLLLHERHCAQSTFKCPLCQLCLPKTAEKKHNSISHQLLVCECGQEYSQLALHKHQETDCNKRMVHCPFKWCNLSFPIDMLADHENICGRKMVNCPVCGEEVSQLELEMHLEAFHNVETDAIDWSKPLGSQTLVFKKSEPKFKCPCGQGFDFQDDMQVHQLTECTFRRMAEDLQMADESGLLPADVASGIVG